ncbi:spore germination protein [Clostridium bowmanii]|uniref:GerAB/ArcD/ProY family transporter n=1 Tax=Clostridium bowmanii TaxID=132925 RepID=UPI001C0DD14F|nr:endospore germination permease [Clostridium bowmanii]MBU3188049.1 spore germination protein [Clostridium bowmanii]MCA1072230.1 spore germination protein [Clostridium bowmanii]
MDNVKKNLLEEGEATAMIVGFIIGTSILALPNGVVQDAKQDGWISVLVGGLYPFYIALLAIYYAKKHPNQDILALSNIYLGRILGTICNVLFMVEFGIFTVAAIVSLSNIFRVYATYFLTPIKIFIPTILLAIYLSDKGIKILGRINKISLYTIIILAVALSSTVKSGNYLNLFPIFGSGVKNILSGSTESALAYGGMEAIYLIYPYLKDKNKVKKISLKALSITMAIYIWVTFVCIYVLGYKVTSIALWPVLLVTEGVNIPILNSFRFLYLFLWSIVMFKIIANEQYAFVYILSDVLKIKDKSKLYWFIFPIALYLCLEIKNEVQRRAIIGYLAPKIVLFNIAYISIIAILIFLKDKSKK